MIARFLALVARLLSGVRIVRKADTTPGRQRIYFGNHTSHLDAVVLWSALPPEVRRRARPVAGRDYWERGPVRRYLSTRSFRAILIDRLPPNRDRSEVVAAAQRQIQCLADAMGTEDSLIVFPEGTRGSCDVPGPFKSGLYHLARLKPDAELVPVYLHNMSRILPKGESLPVPMLSRIVFGDPIRLEPGESKEDFLARAREAVIALSR